MLQTFSKYKHKIDSKNQLLTQELISLKIPWAKEFFSDISLSAQRGKGIRGGLVLFIVEAFGKKINNDALLLALSLEYYHNALLIHDDIMDHDDLRRGFPSAHYRYQLLAKGKGIKDVKDFGNSMAICLGDASIFAAQFFLAKIKGLDNRYYRSLIELLGKEFIKVGLGQAQDLAFTHCSKLPSSKEVMEMYSYKTARYTFSLPLMAGAMLAGKDRNVIKSLDKLGLALGFIFQLSDDNLSLYGDSQKTGKALGNDIRENKKTLYRVMLYEKAGKADRSLIESIFSKGRANKKDVEIIKKFIYKYQINLELDKLMDSYVSQAEKYSANLKIEKQFLKMLAELIAFLKTREK
jgi:geranylgeranyl diphosphate synthase type I